MAALAIPVLPAPEHAAADPVFVFQGGGYGHSVGLSQFGAYGMARQGYTAEQILTHYYTGTAIQDADPAVLAAPLWVGLSQEQSGLSLTTTDTGNGPAGSVTYAQGGASLSAAPGQTATIDRLGDGTCRLQTPQGTLTGSCAIDAEWDGWEEQPTTAVVLDGCSLPNWNHPEGTVYQPCTYARGGLRIRPDDDSTTINLSVEIEIEAYVLGISESPAFWGANGGMEALRAQAVAARTYALRRAYDRGDPAGRPSCSCNLYDTTVDQFYVGWGHGTSEWTEAVTSTTGKVVTHPSTLLDGVQLPIQAFYSSSTFGWTEHSEHGFSTYVPYLRGVDDHWSQLPEVSNHSARWTVELTGPELAERLPGLSSVTGIEVAACSPSGAILELTFQGSGGPKTYRTSELRTMLGIKSMQIYNVGAPPPAELPCDGPGTDPLPPGGPVSVADIHIDDDQHDDSRGDGDGVAEAGEIVELTVTLRNDGQALSGIEAGLSTTGPSVEVLYNDRSAYPALAPGASHGNDDDWDLAIGDSAEGTVTLHLTVTSANGGPWTLSVPVAVGPSSGERASKPGAVSVGNVGGGPADDVAVAYVTAGGAPRLRVLDPDTGRTISDVQVAAAGVAVADIEPVPGTGGVALLLVPDTDRSVVRIHDAATGRRTGTRRFGGATATEWVDLVVLPDSAPGGDLLVGVYGAARQGGRRVVVKGMASWERVSVMRLGSGTQVLAVTSHDDVTGDGVADVAVLAQRSFGSHVLLGFDPSDGSSTNVTSLAQSREPETATGITLVGGDPAVAVFTRLAGGRIYATTIDPATGSAAPGVTLPLTEVAAVEAMSAPIPGTLAVLGTDGNGSTQVVVLDIETRQVLTRVGYPPGALHALAAPVSSGGGETTLLSALIETGGSLRLVVAEPFSGSGTWSIAIG